MTAGGETRTLVALCENVDVWTDEPCTGRIRFRWGMSQSEPCDMCGARCGIAVAAWERVEIDSTPVRAGTEETPDV